jgi:hypothetical protein
MQGSFVDLGGLFSYTSPEARVPPDHPLRKIRDLVREVLSELGRRIRRRVSGSREPAGHRAIPCTHRTHPVRNREIFQEKQGGD